MGRETSSGSGADKVAVAEVSRKVKSLFPRGLAESGHLRQGAWLLANLRQLWGFEFLVCPVVAVRVKLL